MSCALSLRGFEDGRDGALGGVDGFDWLRDGVVSVLDAGGLGVDECDLGVADRGRGVIGQFVCP